MFLDEDLDCPSRRHELLRHPQEVKGSRVFPAQPVAETGLSIVVVVPEDVLVLYIHRRAEIKPDHVKIFAELALGEGIHVLLWKREAVQMSIEPAEQAHDGVVQSVQRHLGRRENLTRISLLCPAELAQNRLALLINTLQFQLQAHCLCGLLSLCHRHCLFFYVVLALPKPPLRCGTSASRPRTGRRTRRRWRARTGRCACRCGKVPGLARSQTAYR